ncbi:hypothetical protein NL676_019146 [Syzygium grande]|nr:hypothetical protein NL676_019146 [Syzygium grande]
MAKSSVAINSSTNSSWLLLVSFFLIVATSLRQSEAAVCNVLSYGAKPDRRSDSTQAFQRAWSSACTSAMPATVYVPQGNFVLGPVVFTGPCKSRILFQIAGTLVAPSNYWSLGNSGYSILFIKSISFQWSSDVVITGITSMNSQMFHIAIANSANVLIQNVKIRAPAQSPNTDSIHISSSTGVNQFASHLCLFISDVNETSF